MIESGKINKLKAIELSEFGMYLDGGELGNILLPNSFMPEDLEVGDEIEVFIYFDSEDRIIATTKTPKACVGEFAFLEVKSQTSFGAFLDWGLPKDLFVPFKEQHETLAEDKSYVFYVYYDEESNRIAASSKTYKYLSNDLADYKKNDEVKILVTDKTDLGFKVIVENKFKGMIFFNEIFQKVKPGDKLNAYIKQVREDGKIDLSLQKVGYDSVNDLSEKILERIKQNHGVLSITDKSSPEIIHKEFGVSKKNFKRAVGKLLKDKKIRFESRKKVLII